MNREKAIFQLTYTSTPTIEFGIDDLIKLLIDVRDSNKAHHITGILIFNKDRFIQSLEGTEASVETLHENICRDGRHDNVRTLSRKTLDAREFPNWSMAFADSGSLESSSFRSFNPALNNNLHINTTEVMNKALLLLNDYAACLKL
jgi:Sensors of blue-light using FAD